MFTKNVLRIIYKTAVNTNLFCSDHKNLSALTNKDRLNIKKQIQMNSKFLIVKQSEMDVELRIG